MLKMSFTDNIDLSDSLQLVEDCCLVIYEVLKIFVLEIAYRGMKKESLFAWFRWL